MILRSLIFGLLALSLLVLLLDAVFRSTTGTALTSMLLSEFWYWIWPQAIELSPRSEGRDWTHIVGKLPLWLVLGLSGIACYVIDRRRRIWDDSASNRPLTTRRLIGIIVVGGATFALAHEILPAIWIVSAPSFLTIGDAWMKLHAGGELALQTLPPNSLWNTFVLVPLRLPVSIVVGLLGFLLYCVGKDQTTPKGGLGFEGAAAQGAGSAPAPSSISPRSELQSALASCRGALISVGVFSGLCNILMLSGAFFMLQVYDRVLPSRSIATLLALAILVAGLFLVHALLDTIRRRILMRVGTILDDSLSGRIYHTVVRLPLVTASQGDGLQPMRDIDSIRSFLSGQGPTALFDLPWMPVYIAIIFYMHTMLGLTALVGAIVLVLLTLTTEALTRRPMKDVAAFQMSRNGLAEASRRNSEVLTAMGMTDRVGARWTAAHQDYLTSNQQMGDVANDLGAFSRSLRLLLQSAVLGLGAYLVINGQATAGIIIAGAILVSRALAPVDLAIANWKGFVSARQSWHRLEQLLERLPAVETPMQLPAPQQSLTVEQASAVPPGLQKLVVQDVNFALESGHGLGIIGPSGSGKSSLVRLLVGVWAPARGQVRLDRAALSQWSSEELGRHIGYLPQDVELFSGSVAENIARFEPNSNPEHIIAAARSAGVHDLIVNLPNGYETELGDQGKALSAGQRQRVALARALYRDPFFVVLDEPNSNLDSEGEAALTQAILGVRSRGGIVIVVAHRQSALAGVDMVLALAQGKQAAFGPKDEVLAQVLRPQPIQRPSGLSIVPDGGKVRQ